MSSFTWLQDGMAMNCSCEQGNCRNTEAVHAVRFVRGGRPLDTLVWMANGLNLVQRRLSFHTLRRLRQVADTLAEIHERHEAVKELEKSLLDLHQIFLDMAVLVEAQGEMLDNIGAQARRCAFV